MFQRLPRGNVVIAVGNAQTGSLGAAFINEFVATFPRLDIPNENLSTVYKQALL